MFADKISARAHLKVQHDRPYDFDEKRGLWVYKTIWEGEGHNILTDAGRVLIHTLIYGTAAQKTSASAGVGFNYIGISNDATAPAAGDTALTGELSSDGLQRVQGTVTLATGSGTITTVENVFTYTGIPNQGVQKTAVFDAAVAGNMTHEILFTQRILATNDSITLTFSITLT